MKHNDVRRLGYLGLLVLASAGCRAVRPAPLSESAVQLDLPLVHQDELYACGLASITALTQYWGLCIPPAESAALARTAAEKHGLSGGELRDALEELGMDAFVFRGSLDRTATGLYAAVDAGRPAIVMLSPDGNLHHYCLVLGYDEPRATLILLDPVRGEVLTPVASFERNWERCRRFTLLACPKQGSSEPATGPPVPTLSANSNQE